MIHFHLHSLKCECLVLEKTAQCGVFKYHPKCFGVKISHLSFVDDILILAIKLLLQGCGRILEIRGGKCIDIHCCGSLCI